MKRNGKGMEKEYKEGDTIYILMEGVMASTLMDDWVNHNYGCDMLVHHSKKHPGCVVIETKSLMWANRIIKWYQCKKVTYQTK